MNFITLLFVLMAGVGVCLLWGSKLKKVSIPAIKLRKWRLPSRITFANLQYWLLAVYLIHLQLYWLGIHFSGANKATGLGLLFVVLNFHWYFIVTMVVVDTPAWDSAWNLYFAYLIVGGLHWFLLGWFISAIAWPLKGKDGRELVLIDFRKWGAFFKRRQADDVIICPVCGTCNNPTFSVCWSCHVQLSPNKPVLQQAITYHEKRSIWQTILCMTTFAYVKDVRSINAAYLFLPFAVVMTMLSIALFEGLTGSRALDYLLEAGVTMLLLGWYIQQVVWKFFRPGKRENEKMLPVGIRIYLYNIPVGIFIGLIVTCVLLVPVMVGHSLGAVGYFQDLMKQGSYVGFIVKSVFLMLKIVLWSVISAVSLGVVYRYFYE